MISALPTHVLSVTPESVRELDGREALSKLWTLFTKCKESIENGRRLENISWRLWYRDMLSGSAMTESQIGFEKYLVNTQSLNEKPYIPPTPMETHDNNPTDHLPSPSEAARKQLRPLPVGQIICNILPTSSLSQSSATSTNLISPSMSSLARTPRAPGSGDPPLLRSGSTFLPLLPLLPSQLPTPATERDESMAMHSHVDLPMAIQPQPAFLPVIISATDNSVIAPPPRLVVVNPTPGPTPHPTPPATPLSFLAAGENGKSRVQHGNFLAPPSTRAAPESDSESVATHDLRVRSQLRSTPPTQDVEITRSEDVESRKASHNTNRLSMASTTSTSSTAATNTTSDTSSSSQLSLGATSMHSDEDEPQKSDTPMASPTFSPQVSTSVKSTRSTSSAGARVRHGAPGLIRRASSGAAGAVGRRGAGFKQGMAKGRGGSEASRSRSRDGAGSRAAGALAATMGMTTVTAAGSGVAKKRGGKAGGKRVALARNPSRGAGFTGGAALKRTLSHEEVEEVTDEGDFDDEEEEVAKGAAIRKAEQAEAAARLEREREIAAAVAAKEAAAAVIQQERDQRDRAVAGASKAKFKFGSNSDNGSAAGTEVSSRQPGSLLQTIPSALDNMASSRADVKGKGRSPTSSAQEAEQTQARRTREAVVEPARNVAEVSGVVRQSTTGQRMRDEDAQAEVSGSLPDPMLPQQGAKRTILLESDSEYSDTDGDGDESWMSEDGPAVETTAGQSSSNARQPSQPEKRTPQQPQTPEQARFQREQQQLQQQLQLQLQLQQAEQRTTAGGLQRTYSNVSGRHTRRELQHIQQRREAALRVQRAAALLQRQEEERQRQKEMFAKKATSSFQNLTEKNRTQSFGYLSQLMNPDPAIFPANHPYRRGYSSGELPSLGMSTITPMTSTTAGAQRQAAQPGPPQRSEQPPAPRPNVEKQMEPDVNRTPQQAHQQPHRPQQPTPPRAPRRAVTQDDSKVMPAPALPSPNGEAQQKRALTRPPSPVKNEKRNSASSTAIALALRGLRGLGFGLSKSGAVGPLATQVAVGSVQTSAAAVPPPSNPPDNQKGSRTGTGGYRPKGPLPGQEMESDSEDEVENGVQLSHSIAQDRLKQFAARRGIAPAAGEMPAPQEGDEIPAWAREPERPTQQPPQETTPLARANPARPEGLRVTTVDVQTPPAPIPMHPYHLPVNALPSTPRTVRRAMLKNEMPESLRRQLLWERKQAAPIRRTSSSGVVGGGPARNNALTGLRPLTTTPNKSMVQLHAKGAGNQSQQHLNPGPSHMRQESAQKGPTRGDRRASSGKTEQVPGERDGDTSRSMPRSYDGYHRAGW